MKNVQHLIPVAVIRNAEGKILFVKKITARSEIAIDKWELPGGTIAFGDSFEEALQNKIRDYLGVEIIVDSVIPYVHSTVTEGIENNRPTKLQFFLIGALCRLKETSNLPLFHLKPGKIAKATFLTVDEYLNLPDTERVPGDQEILNSLNTLT